MIISKFSSTFSIVSLFLLESISLGGAQGFKELDQPFEELDKLIVVPFNPECPCINSTEIFRPMKSCTTSLGQSGVRPLASFGIDRSITDNCYPLSYGSSSCNRYDDLFASECQGNSPPGYCSERWCYVDKEKCIMSDETVYKSDLFGKLDFYYSYTTCNSTESSWFSTTKEMDERPSLNVVIPAVYPPFLIKKTESGTIADFSGPEYYNSSIPFEGAAIDYVERISDWKIKYTTRSKGSDKKHPSSAFTATVRDVQAGLADMAVGQFWVTTERLRMVTFTTPVTIDRTFIVTRRPSEDNSVQFQIQKMWTPFSNSLWIVLAVFMLVISALSIWFASPGDTSRRIWKSFRNDEWRNSSYFKRALILFRFYLEALLQKGVFAFGAAADQDANSSLSMKFLIFGFSFLILMTVSCYVANLTVFLVQSRVTNTIDSMEQAIGNGLRICAHPAIEVDLKAMWKAAKFVFNHDVAEYEGLFQMYDAGKCDILAIGEETRYSRKYVQDLCSRDLVFTKGKVIEIPIAFPIRNDYAAGMSHMFYKGEKESGFTLDSILKEYEPVIANCNVDINAIIGDAEQSSQITIVEMAFPLIVVATCVAIAIIIKLLDRRNVFRAVRIIANVTKMTPKNAEKFLDAAKFAHLDIDDVCDVLQDTACNKEEEENQTLKRIYARRITQKFVADSSCNEIGSNREKHWSSYVGQISQRFSSAREIQEEDNVSQRRNKLNRAISDCLPSKDYLFSEVELDKGWTEYMNKDQDESDFPTRYPKVESECDEKKIENVVKRCLPGILKEALKTDSPQIENKRE